MSSFRPEDARVPLTQQHALESGIRCHADPSRAAVESDRDDVATFSASMDTADGDYEQATRETEQQWQPEPALLSADDSRIIAANRTSINSTLRTWCRRVCIFAILTELGRDNRNLQRLVSRQEFVTLHRAAELAVSKQDDRLSTPPPIREVHQRFFANLSYNDFNKLRSKFVLDAGQLKRLVTVSGEQVLVPFTSEAEQRTTLSAYHNVAHQRNADLAFKYVLPLHWPTGRAFVRQAYSDVVNRCESCRRTAATPKPVPTPKSIVKLTPVPFLR